MHVLYECTATHALRVQHTTALGDHAMRFPHMLRSGDVPVWQYVAIAVSPLKDLCPRGGRKRKVSHGDDDDPDWQRRRL